MLRPRFPLWPLLVAAALLLPGCKSFYRDVYSPKRNYFKPPKERPAASLLPDTPTTESVAVPAQGTVPAGGGLAPDAGAPAPALPPADAAPGGIPGLDPIPGAPPPAMSM